MTLTTTSFKDIYTGDNVVSVFAFTFKIFANTDLKVTEILIATGAETLLTLTTDYTVSGVLAANGGNVTLVAGALASTKQLVIQRNQTLEQTLDLEENDPQPSANVETQFDKTVAMIQQNKEQIDRAVSQPITATTQINFPSPAASKAIAWDSAGVDLENVDVLSQSDVDAAAASATAADASASSASSSSSSAASSANSASSSASDAAVSAASVDGTRILEGDTSVIVTDTGTNGAVTTRVDGVIVGVWGDEGLSKPTNPCFLVKVATPQSNIAKDGVTIVFGTEIFDIGSNFSANTFTAPVTGKYLFNTIIHLADLDSAAQFYNIRFVSSNRTILGVLYEFAQMSADVAQWGMTMSIIIDMDVNDTVLVQLFQDSGTVQTDLTDQSTFSGSLIC